MISARVIRAALDIRPTLREGRRRLCCRIYGTLVLGYRDKRLTARTSPDVAMTSRRWRCQDHGACDLLCRDPRSGNRRTRVVATSPIQGPTLRAIRSAGGPFRLSFDNGCLAWQVSRRSAIILPAGANVLITLIQERRMRVLRSKSPALILSVGSRKTRTSGTRAWEK